MAAVIGAITLNIAAALESGRDAEGTDSSCVFTAHEQAGLTEALVDAAIQVLGEAVLSDGHDQARRVGIETLSNVFACEEDSDDGEAAAPTLSGRALRSRVSKLLPASELLLSPHGLLQSVVAELKQRQKKKHQHGGSSSTDDARADASADARADASDGEAQAAEIVSLCMQCAGAILSSCVEAELLLITADVWQALSSAASMLTQLTEEEQEGLLNLMSCLALRSTSPEAPAIPSSLLCALGLDAVRWSRAVKGSRVAPIGVALLGQIAALLSVQPVC